MVKTKSRADTFEVIDGVMYEGFMDAQYDSVEHAGVNLFYLSGFKPFCDGDVTCMFPDGVENLKDLIDEMMDLGSDKEAWEVMFADVWRKSHSALARTVENLEKAYQKVRADVDNVGGVRVGYWDKLDELVVYVREMVVADTGELAKKGSSKPIWRIGIDRAESEDTIGSMSKALSDARFVDVFIGSVFRKLIQITRLEETIEKAVNARLSVFDMGQLGQFEGLKAENWDRAYYNLRTRQARKVNGRYVSEK